jgi:Kef-type K+ transport system membrane component KefB/nucleotide-binding universal stress UspA family protein
MLERLNEPVAFFLLIMSIILVTPLLSERVKLPGIIGIILGGMLIGPHVFGLIEAGDRMEFLATIGLVYLMFSAGLEVDINQFNRVRGRSVVFGFFTFILPQLMGMGLGYLLGLEPLGMILLGSAFASHTLIAFPILTRLGITRNQAIAVTTGATVLTDIGAFIVLAVVLGAQSGGLQISYFIQLFLLLSAFTALIILGLPRVGKYFFQRFHGRAIEFQFVVVALFVAALGAELIGVHEVVGAFLAGLAINATLPRYSPVKGHVLFIGEAFFIPVFLLYSGMITDPFSFMENNQTILVAVGVTIVAYVSKFIAALITARIYKYTKAEFWTVYGLSHAQAAVTIPTLIIGLDTGLFDTTLFNAAILMILLTSISSPLIVQRYGPGLQTASEEEKTLPLFERILVPVTNPATQEQLLGLATLLAKVNHGKVFAVNVAQDVGEQAKKLAATRETLNRIDQVMGDPESDIELIPRLDVTDAKGILHTSFEENASIILMGWRGKRTLRESLLGSVIDDVVWGSDTPVILGKLPVPLMGMQRVIFMLPSKVVPQIVLGRMFEANLLLAKALNVPLLIRADESYSQSIEALIAMQETDHNVEVELLEQKQLKPAALDQESISSFIVVPGFGSRKRVADTLGNLPEQLAASFDGNLAILHFDK